VRDIALSAVYVGKRVHLPTVRGGGSNARQRDGVTTYDATWDELVDAEQWHTVRRLLLDPKRRVTRRASRATHLLSMIAVCGVCDSPLQAFMRAASTATSAVRTVTCRCRWPSWTRC